jgi:mono/diheme cytochrome c family protein
MMRLLVAAELVLAIAVLMVVGFLTEREPARQVTEQSRAFVAAEAASSGTTVRLLVLPGRPGPNTLEIEVIRERGSIAPESTLEIEFKYLDADLGTVVARPQRDFGSRFRLDTENLNLAGKWQLLAVVRSPGSFDARVPIRLDIGGLGASASFVEIDRTTAARLWALTIVGIGLVLALATLSRAGWSPVIRRFGVSTGFGAMVLGGALILAGQDSMSEVPSINPVLPDAVSVGTGRTSYMALCAGCHGSDGRGDGLIAASLDPKPVDLRLHVPLHRDADLFRFIRDGIQGTGMKGFADQLDQIDIWHVVNFLQTLTESGQS